MRKRRIITSLCLTVLLVSMIAGYISLPDRVILYKDRSWKRDDITNLSINNEYIETLHDAIVPRKAGDYEASLSLFGIPYKNVTVRVLEDEKVIVGGSSIGIRLYADSLIVIAVGRVNSKGKSPAEEAGIKEGDVIVSLNGEKVGSPEEFSKRIEEINGEVTLGIQTGDGVKNVTLTPEVSEYDNVKRIGLWVRDSTAGVGTLTYMNPKDMSYGALGHGVSDSDTGVKFTVKEGSVEECAIGEIKKGEKGVPGEMKGVFLSNAKVLGNITKNEKEGIFGNLTHMPQGEMVETGHKSEIKKGVAHIRTSLDGKTVEEYEIEILKVSKNTKNPSKGLVIQVTDERLIEKTGGIVQGMSGSPILQDGKLIGAVTHVLVNDPTRGYGIFIENMLEASEGN
ncbi:MAG: SpoIVB peptidase [Clostridia bacterium]|nr:SpoIVB peptidase [Clostridia bacterium]